MSVAWGAEVDQQADLGAVAEARPDGGGWRVRLVYYRAAAGLPAALGAAYEAEPEAEGVFVDPMPCAPVLEELGLLVRVRRLEAVDVAAAAAQFRQALKDRLVTAEEHPALEQAITFAVRRPLAAAYGFERRRVVCDMSPLNAAAFALWGLRRSEARQDPGAWVL